MSGTCGTEMHNDDRRALGWLGVAPSGLPSCSVSRCSGFSYTEVLIATLLIAMLLTPALESLHSGIQGSGIYAMRVENYHRLAGALEAVLAEPFTTLEQEADTAGGAGVIVDAYSDSPGSDWRRLVYLARYDGDNADADNDPFTGVDPGLLWVRVEIEGSAEALVTLTQD